MSIKPIDHRSHESYEWCDGCAPDDYPEGVEMGRCAACGHTRLVKRLGGRMLCRGCAMDLGLYQEAEK